MSTESKSSIFSKGQISPAVLYNLSALQDVLDRFSLIADRVGVFCYYAVKANRHPEILSRIATSDFGFDVASQQELDSVLRAGGKKILATAPYMSPEFMSAVSENGGLLFFDSLDQIRLAESIGIDIDRNGIRLSLPGDYSSFGFSTKEIRELKDLGYPIRHIQAHAGEYMDYETACKRMESLREATEGLALETVDMGGGFGVLSNDWVELEKCLSMMRSCILPKNCKVFIEPGKALVARCGFLRATVTSVKQRQFEQIVVLDASSYNLGWLESRRLAYTSSSQDNDPVESIFLGSTCFEGDIWGRFISPNLKPGDQVIFSTMGAYTTSIASTLHNQPPPPEFVFEDLS